MAEPLSPRGAIPQVALLLVVGSIIGFSARLLGSPDFSTITTEPERAGGDEIAALKAGAATPGRDATTGEPASPETASPVMIDPTPPKMVTFEDVMSQLYNQPGVAFIDARDAGAYEGGHVPGALHLDALDVERDPNAAGPVLKPVPRDHILVVYCSGGDCDLSMRLARLIKAHGYPKVLVYEGGYAEWTREGAPTTTGAEPGSPATAGG